MVDCSSDSWHSLSARWKFVSQLHASQVAVMADAIPAPIPSPASATWQQKSTPRLFLSSEQSTPAHTSDSGSTRAATLGADNPLTSDALSGTTCYTYAEIDVAVAELAAILSRHLDIYEERELRCVLIHMDPSIHYIVSVLACLASGAVLVPLDKSWPIRRVADVAEQCGAKILIHCQLDAFHSPFTPYSNAPTQSNHVDSAHSDPTCPFPPINCHVITMAAHSPRIISERKHTEIFGKPRFASAGAHVMTSKSTVTAPITAESGNGGGEGRCRGDSGICYLLFTSGSTGRPKGVLGLEKGARFERIHCPLQHSCECLPGEAVPLRVS